MVLTIDDILRLVGCHFECNENNLHRLDDNTFAWVAPTSGFPLAIEVPVLRQVYRIYIDQDLGEAGLGRWKVVSAVAMLYVVLR